MAPVTRSSAARQRARIASHQPGRTPVDRLIKPQDSLLLKLPAEILALIVSYLANDKTALASLALVNMRCRQLARPTQFSRLSLNTPRGVRRRAPDVISEIIREAKEASENLGGFGPLIGRCVRYLTVHSYKFFSRRQRKSQSLASSHEEYLTRLAGAVFEALPNVLTLCWLERAINGPAFAALAASGIRHLQLYDTFISDTALELRMEPGSMCLETLSLDCRLGGGYDLKRPDFHVYNNNRNDWTYGSDELTGLYLNGPLGLGNRARNEALRAAGLQKRQKYYLFVQTLMEASAPTLRTLYFHAFVNGRRHEGISWAPLPGRAITTFPRLSVHILGRIRPTVPETVDWLLRAPQLKRLDLSFCHPDGNLEALKTCDLRDLENVGLPSVQTDTNTSAVEQFLELHTHLKKLAIGPTRTETLNTSILPRLGSGQFQCLTSLSLCWVRRAPDPTTPSNNTEIVELAPASVLEYIGQITNLEQLWLGSKRHDPLNYLYRWLGDHELLRSCLAPLHKLRRLGLEGDSYDTLSSNWFFQEPSIRNRLRDYYTQKSGSLRRDEGGMRGTLQDMILLRARPELDKQYLEQHVSAFADRDDTEIWQPTNEQLQESHSVEVVIRDPYLRIMYIRPKLWWEILHRNQMLAQAEAYAAAFPTLEWTFFGELPMRITRPRHGVGVIARPTSADRISYTSTGLVVNHLGNPPPPSENDKVPRILTKNLFGALEEADYRLVDSREWLPDHHLSRW